MPTSANIMTVRFEESSADIGRTLHLHLAHHQSRELASRLAALSSGAAIDCELLWRRASPVLGNLLVTLHLDQVGHVPKQAGDRLERVDLHISRAELDRWIAFLTRAIVLDDAAADRLRLTLKSVDGTSIQIAVESNQPRWLTYWGRPTVPPVDADHLRVVLNHLLLGTYEPFDIQFAYQNATDIYGDGPLARREAIRSIGTLLSARLAVWGDMPPLRNGVYRPVMPWPGTVDEIKVRIDVEWDSLARWRGARHGWLELSHEVVVLAEGLYSIEQRKGELVALQVLDRILADREVAPQAMPNRSGTSA